MGRDFQNLLRPRGIAVNKTGNLFIADAGNSQLRTITPEGMVSTVEVRPRFYLPIDVAVDGQNAVYVIDLDARIRRIAHGKISTVFELEDPRGVSIDEDGYLLISGQCAPAQNKGGMIGRLSPSGEWSLIAGGGSNDHRDGFGIEAGFKQPSGIWVGEDYVYVFDRDRVRKIV